MAKYAGRFAKIEFEGKVVADGQREFDALIASKVMGWKLDYEFVDYLGAPTVPALQDQYDEWGILPELSTDLATAHTILPRIQELGLVEPFIEALIKQLDIDASVFNSAIEVNPYDMKMDGWKFSFAILSTSPEQICRAALEAVEAKK